jgi:hypothetical protein
MDFKRLLFKILLFTFLFSLPVPIYAFSYYSTESQNFDSSLIEQGSSVYSNPTQIYITQVKTDSEILLRDPVKWVQTLYYYSITRLHFSDLPYTYLLDENGIIYQGRKGGVGANPELKDIDGAVVIGYLSNNPILTNRASESLSKMVEEISYNWGISKLLTVKLNITQQEGKLSTVTAEGIVGEFLNSVREALINWKGYEEEHLEYKAKIEEVVYEESVQIGERLKVAIKIKNLNDYVWLTDRDPIYISVKDGKESNFAINQDWESFSKPISISEKNILPGESVELEFELEGKVLLGEASESFEILKFEGKPFEGSSFDVKFNIERGDKQLVEVASPKYDFVNIRECRWYSCKVLDSADNGAILIFESEEEGWTRLKFGVDLYGWVNSAYLKKI